ncbi:hypothetical protein QWY93_17115 [Echinicola jeungdonensis]|uniref:Uncharacterized protein n=1 Tax=Echinicola jeungdonensis TaxID=709343 RepID=A0ABV5J5L3_9BACT|nr:hypothetical protein [Echinicola jeungdonensis]MDN3671037.1 hypothetical protein [Echinicola jeungdonensis]
MKPIKNTPHLFRNWWLFLFLILSACLDAEKQDSRKDFDNDQPDSEFVKENTVIISDENSELLSTESEIENGIYKIEFSGTVPEIKVDDVIVGDEEEGFLRRITGLEIDGKKVTLQTKQANMEDIFKNATLEFNTTIADSSGTNDKTSNRIKRNYLAEGVRVSNDGFSYDFSNTVIYQEGPVTFMITKGTAKFNPNFSFKGEYQDGFLSYLEFKTENANLLVDCDLSLNTNASLDISDFNKTLADYDIPLTVPVYGIPVKVIVNTQLVASFSANVEAAFDITTGFTGDYFLSTGVEYKNDKWDSNFDLNPKLVSKPLNKSGSVNLGQNLTITPKVSLKFFGVLGPYWSVYL